MLWWGIDLVKDIFFLLLQFYFSEIIKKKKVSYGFMASWCKIHQFMLSWPFCLFWSDLAWITSLGYASGLTLGCKWCWCIKIYWKSAQRLSQPRRIEALVYLRRLFPRLSHERFPGGSLDASMAWGCVAGRITSTFILLVGGFLFSRLFPFPAWNWSRGIAAPWADPELEEPFRWDAVTRSPWTGGSNSSRGAVEVDLPCFQLCNLLLPRGSMS